MFTNILIGVDGRQGGRDAITLARQLAGPDASLTLAHVYSAFPGRGAGEALAIEHAESQQLLRRESELASVDARLAVVGDRPVGRGLHELADERRADLLVVGSTRRALLGRALLGDDCRAALDGAPCAIAIAPRGYAQAPRRLRRLGVGYDGSPESERALSTARELARLYGGGVRAYWVVSLRDVREERPIPVNWPKAIDELIERHSERLAQLHDVHGVVTYGRAREELARLGKDVDLLIVGSRGYGPLGRLFHGSVSRYLVGGTNCPLLVLPRAAVRQPEDASREARAAITAET